MKKLEWQNIKKKVNDLIPYPGNPRTLTERQKEFLEKSLKKFNLMSVPVINTDGVIVSGHQRVKVLQLLGRGEEIIDVRIPNRKLTQAEVREANLLDNKTMELGSWDLDALANFGEDELVDVGFEIEELKELFGLDNAEGVDVDMDRLMVITVEPPESPKSKERMAFHCDTIEEYNKIIEYFKKGKNVLDKNKLLGMMI
ncbi:MAG: hypothetical protein DDT42_00456 [candidate division WS2 bacterium]|uniref:ParB/Sulfiredoxin domain-containing protein n=1 Tax=Psychracetigena formicireducens TaxID=2986056 RepID=A0A9E2F0Q0_PSYF1|nr:hypothetical protein [Candidatus Psychracetigena formicireducens]